MEGAVGSPWKFFKELTIIVQVAFALVLLISGFAISALQAVLFTVVRPFHPALYRKLNFYLTYSLHSQLVFLVEWWSSSRIQIYADSNDFKVHFGKEHALLLANHTYEIDWLMGWLFCDRLGVLGNAKSVVKKVYSYLPLLGWSWKFQEMVFLERDWEKDKKSLGQQLGNLVNYPDPMWLALFPEGTRFTPEKHQASMEVAARKGLPQLKHHLLPRTKGFVASLAHLRGKVPAIYDLTVAMDPNCQTEPSFRSILQGRQVCTKFMVRRFPLEQIPQDEEGAARWLHKLYQEKDTLLDNFLQIGEFLSSSQRSLSEFQNYNYVELPRRSYSLLNFLSWAGLTLVPLGNYCYSVLSSGNYAKMGIILALVVAAKLGMEKLINLTRISKGSAYGGTHQGDDDARFEVQGKSKSTPTTFDTNSRKRTASPGGKER